MTTAQESPNGHHVVPPPCSVQNPPELNRADLPTGKANNIPNPSYVHIDTNQLPDRCQFTFSDGRQCTMARSDIHPSLCRFHSEREDQLFGDPSPGGYVVGRALDLPELYSACRDLTTAAGVNRALAQVFRLLAQRRISRQEAATFGHLAQLLLRTLSAMRVLAGESPAANVYQQDELRGVDKDHQECRIPGIPEATAGLSPDNKVDAVLGEQPTSTNLHPSAPIAPAAPSEPLAECTARKSSPGMNTCADVVRNSRKMSTSEIAGFKLTQNEHLQKMPGGWGPSGARKSLPTG